MLKGLKSLSLQDRQSIVFLKTLVLRANIASIIPGLSSQIFAIETYKNGGDYIRNSKKLKNIIDNSIKGSFKEFEYKLGKGLLPFANIVNEDFAIDSDLSDKYTRESVSNELKEIIYSVSESP